MDQPQAIEPLERASTSGDDPMMPVGPAARSAESPLAPQSCPTCGAVNAGNNVLGTASSYVYALGKIGPRFPTPSVEKEYHQVVGRDGTKGGLTDPQVMHKILSNRHNRYLVRKLCWVMTVESIDTYILVPRDPADFDLLVESLHARPQPTDLDVVIGVKGPMAAPEMCNGLMAPIVAFDQVYSFDRHSLIEAIPPEKASAKKRTADNEFASAAETLLDRVMQLT